MREKVTMSYIAKDLGISASTVSRALRNDSRISTTQRERIIEHAKSLGYRPNPLISALMANRKGGQRTQTDTIALITDYNGPEPWCDKDVCRWEYEGISQRADELGFQLEVFPLDNYEGSLRQLEKVLITRGIRGVLLGFSRAQTVREFFASESFAIAGLSTYFRWANIDRANFHGLYNVRLALTQMQRLGYKRTGLVVPEFNNRISGYLWSGGFLDWQFHLPEANRCTPYLPDEGASSKSFYDWLEHEQPDSLVVYKHPVRTLLAKKGLSIPEDIGVSYLYRTQKEMSSAAGIDGNLQALGAAALDLVVEKLNTNSFGLPRNPKEVLIKGNWKAGESVH